MLNVCSVGCAKCIGLSALSFCTGMLCGMFVPIAAVAVIVTAMLTIISWLCLFKW